MLAWNICLILWLGKVAVFLSTLLCLRVIETRLVIESSNLLRAEKAKIE
jgi:hypothetical protein